MNHKSLINDILKEINTIAAGKSSKALAQLLDFKVFLDVPEAKIVNIGEIFSNLASNDFKVVGIYFKFFGGIEGHILIYLPVENVKLILGLLLPESINDGSELDKLLNSHLAKSALKEVGNIVANSYVNAIVEFLNLEKTVISVPFYSCDYLTSVVDTLLIQIAQASDETITCDVNFKTEKYEFSTKILFFLEQESMSKISKKVADLIGKGEE